MVFLSKTWDQTVTTFASAVNQGLQYQEFGFAILTNLLAVGWTWRRGSNSAAVSTSQNINASTDIVWGTETSQVHSWFVLDAPSGKGNPSGLGHYLAVSFNHLNTDTTPQNISFALGYGNTTSGTTLTWAIATAGGDTDVTLSLAQCIPWTSATAGNFSMWTTTDGDFFFGVQATGELFYRSFLMLRDDPDNARGSYTMTLFGVSSNSADVITVANLNSAAGWRNLLNDGAAPGSRALAHCSIWDLTNWTLGEEVTDSINYWRDVEIMPNGTTNNRRDLGFLVDCRGVPGLTTLHLSDTNDDGTNAPFELIVIGDIAIPCDNTLIIPTPVDWDYRGYFSCIDPSVVSVIANDATGTSWRVTFAMPMADNPALRAVTSYLIFETLAGVEVVGGHQPAILDVTPENVANPSYVDLTTEEHQDGTEYDLAVYRIEVA